MADSPLIITLDGPAGVGKTTLARMTAQALGLAYLDTGAMFRTTALRLGEGGWHLPEEEMACRLGALSFGLEGVGEASRLTCNGQTVGDEVRTEQVGLWASKVAACPAVREFQKHVQRQLGASTPLVVEGRDMGSVVFPQAARKFFLDADPAVRARRRADQLAAMGQPADLAEIEAAIRVRDERDRNRPIAPLAPAPDAVIVDTSQLTLEQVFARIMEAVDGLRTGRGQ